MEEGLTIAQEGIVHELPTLSSRELIERIHSVRFMLDYWLSLSADVPGLAAEDGDRLLAWKGLTAAAAEARHAAMGDEARTAGEKVAEARRRLQQRYQAVVPSERADEDARVVRKAIEELETRETELARLIHWDIQLPTVRRLVAALPNDAVFVDMIRYTHFAPPRNAVKESSGTRHYAAIVIWPGQDVVRVDLGPAIAIENNVAAWRERIRDGGRDPGTTGRAVRRLIWDPIEPHVRGARVVLVAPDGALNFAAWGALPDGEGSYLVKHHAFATVGSGRQLIAMASARAKAAEGGLLAVGGVDYGAEPGRGAEVASRAATVTNGAIVWGALSGAKAEAEDAAGLFGRRHPGAAATRLAGADATRERLRKEMSGKRYLHLATHGYFAPSELKSVLRPDDATTTLKPWEGMGRGQASGWFPELLSGLVWAGANRPVKDDVQSILEHDNGAIMTAEEVSGLDLKGCELAVLSACETGLGQTAGGEGVLALQRAFGQAGCRTVIASLWKVDDGATRELMASFYGHLWGGRSSTVGCCVLHERPLYRRA
jgi:CHAT domain-containing protein